MKITTLILFMLLAALAGGIITSVGYRQEIAADIYRVGYEQECAQTKRDSKQIDSLLVQINKRNDLINEMCIKILKNKK